MEFCRQEYWSGLPFPSPGDLPNPRGESGSPELQADSLLSEPQGKPPKIRGDVEEKKKPTFKIGKCHKTRMKSIKM